MAVCNVVSYNHEKIVEVSWITENFHVMGDIIFSPIFHPIPNCYEEWRIAMRFSDPKNTYPRTKLDLFLSKQYSYIKECYLEVESIEISSYHIDKLSSSLVCIREETTYLLYSGNINRSSYKNDELIVNAKLTVSGCRPSYSAIPRLAIDFETNCQDLLRDLEALYGDPTTADVTFLVEGQKLFAHSSIIRCRSTVFAKMLDRDMLERTRCVCITDANYHVFNCFLMYLYTAKLKDKNWDTVYNLYSLAEKYAVLGLKKTCSRWLGVNLDVDTVSECTALAALHEDVELKDVAKRFIRDHLSDVLETTGWKFIVSSQSGLASEVLSFGTSDFGAQHLS